MVQQIPPTGLSNNRPFRNKIINGDFKIFQRGVSATTAGNNTYTTADRWKTQISTDGAMTTEQESLSLADQATTGSQKAWEIKCTSTDSSIASNQYALFLQSIEAQFVQDFLYGTSSAKTLTCSFWVKSSLTGTYGFFFIKGDTTAYYLPIEFTIDSANTWEKKIIEISPTAGSTSLITSSGGVIDNDNGIGIDIGICLAMGSNYQGTNNTWTSSAHYTTSNQVNFLSNTSNNFYITSFQLEVGNDATEFEVLPFDVQFQRCQRYFETNYDYEGGYYPVSDVNYDNVAGTHQMTVYIADQARCMVPFKVKKRDISTCAFYRIDGLGDGSTAGRWDFYDGGEGNWQQIDGSQTVGEVSEYGLDINFIDTALEKQESFIVYGGWTASAEL